MTQKPETVPRGYVHCGICGKFYPLKQKHECKTAEPKPKAIA